MSTKTQKLTNSRESPVLVQRGGTGYTRYVQQHQRQSRHANETLSQRLGHFYPMIVTLVVCSVLYGIYTHTFQPTPIDSIHINNPIGYELWIKFKDVASHYYELWKQTFTKLKEVGPSLPETGESHAPPEYQLPDIIPSTPPRDGFRNPNFHHPHPVDNTIQREIDRITREMDQHIEEARKKGQTAMQMLEEKRNKILGNLKENIENMKQSGEKLLENKGEQFKDSFDKIADQWENNIQLDKQFIQENFEYAKEKGQDFMDKIQNNIHQHDIKDKIQENVEAIKERGQEFLGHVPSQQQIVNNIHENVDYAKLRGQDILGHLPTQEQLKSNLENVKDYVDEKIPSKEDLYQDYLNMKQKGQTYYGQVKDNLKENLEYVKDNVAEDLKKKVPTDYDWTTLKGVGKDMHREVPINMKSPKVDENIDILEPIREKIPTKDVVLENIDNVLKDFKHKGREFIQSIEDKREEYKEKFSRDPARIKVEIDKVLKEIKESNNPHLLQSLKGRTFETMEDLQELQYKLRDGYREAREHLYRNKRNINNNQF
ncbi:hypothetical protein CYY_002336 [Polysphondylium violaceum]|uniref:Uncharacterized protein n=1 Tax=Polysphondylium violaceum TaxID=133409 RepID=A0A8J4V9R2_9MYCE|nr:hypothetical protein CYY_002336 [Polysphondylium violaceum]